MGHVVAAIIIGVVLVVLVVGYWRTRNARVPTQTEITEEGFQDRANVDPLGKPMDWEKSEKPPDY